MLESRVREGDLKAEVRTTRIAQLDAELRTLKESMARYQGVITQLQETKRRLESENQRLIQSSMSAQADVSVFLSLLLMLSFADAIACGEMPCWIED